MPIISRFLGIVISLQYNDHAPPHFHAAYGDFKITVEIHTSIISGSFPPRALRAVLEWNDLYRSQLLLDWEKARNHENLDPIDPLE